MKTQFVRRFAAMVVLAFGLVACGGGDGDLAVEQPRARSTAPDASAGAVYFDLRNGTDADVALVGGSVEADVAAVVELHETVAVDDEDGEDQPDGDGDHDGHGDHDDHGDHGHGGMQMREVSSIEVPAGETVTLEPGGLHVMLLDLAGPLVAETSFELTLTFDDGTEQTVTVEVADQV